MMFNFIKRFIAAWKIARDPKVLNTIRKQAQERLAHEKTLGDVRQNAKVGVSKLLPKDRWKNRNRGTLLTVKCAEVFTEQEADQVLKESHIDNKPKLRQLGTMSLCQPAPLNLDRAMEEHLKKFSK